MKVDISGSIGRAVAGYTGAEVLELEVVPDLFVPGCYAVQALCKQAGENASISQFLIEGVPLQNVAAGDLIDVVFTCWPPRPVVS